jgi:hypothetical protein
VDPLGTLHVVALVVLQEIVGVAPTRTGLVGVVMVIVGRSVVRVAL